jgi:hypothetical protein
MFDKIRMALKLDGKYYCENCGNTDYPVIVMGRKFCNHCSGAASDENKQAYLKSLEQERVAKEEAAIDDACKARKNYLRLLELLCGGKCAENDDRNDSEITSIEHELDSFFIKYHITNKLKAVVDCLSAVNSSVSFHSFFWCIDDCRKALRGWWGEEAFLEKVERLKDRILDGSLAKLNGELAGINEVAIREDKVTTYIMMLRQYKDKFGENGNYSYAMGKAKDMLSEDYLQIIEKGEDVSGGRGCKIEYDIVQNPNAKKQYEETPEETTFLDALMKSAGKYAPYINLYREANGAITVQYYNESKGGPLTVGTVKLQGKTKNINIKNPSMGTNYDDVFKVDGELDALLPHVGKFVEKIKNNERF